MKPPAPGPGERRLGHERHQHRSHGGVHGVAPGPQGVGPRARRHRMACGDHSTQGAILPAVGSGSRPTRRATRRSRGSAFATPASAGVGLGPRVRGRGLVKALRRLFRLTARLLRIARSRPSAAPRGAGAFCSTARPSRQVKRGSAGLGACVLQRLLEPRVVGRGRPLRPPSCPCPRPPLPPPAPRPARPLRPPPPLARRPEQADRSSTSPVRSQSTSRAALDELAREGGASGSRTSSRCAPFERTAAARAAS